MTDVVLAVDLGGTNLRMSAVGKGGEIFAHAHTATPKNATPDEFLVLMTALADECRGSAGTDKKIIAIGVGAPANFNSDGVLTHVTNIPSLTGMNLKADLSARLAVPVILENDATAAAIGENWLGASKDVDDSIMITLGTGVGGGVIVKNEPVRGIDGTAGRIGHVCVEPDGVPCGCGSHGCIEQYASATAIVRMAREAGLDVQTSHEVYELASGSPPYKGGVPEGRGGSLSTQEATGAAKEVFKTMGRYLGITLSGLVNTLNPEMIVIGGGAAASWDEFIGPLTKELRARAFHEPAERAKVVRGRLGDDAGILGAAHSAFLT